MQSQQIKGDGQDLQALARNVLTFEHGGGGGAETGSSQVWLHEYVLSDPIQGTFSSSRQAYLDLTFRRPLPCSGSFYERWGDNRSEPIGRALFIPPGAPLFGACSAGQVVQLTCLLDASLFEDLLTDLSDRAREHCLDIREPNVLRSLERVYLELQRPEMGSRLLIEAQLVSACVDVARHLHQFGADKRGGLPRWRIRIIEERLREEGPPPTVAELARLCNMSTRHLARAFSQENGHSIAEHVRAASLARAQQMLAEGNLTLKEIAARLGFSSRSTFSAAYRRQTGRSPLQDRARLSPRHRGSAR